MRPEQAQKEALNCMTRMRSGVRLPLRPPHLISSFRVLEASRLCKPKEALDAEVDAIFQGGQLRTAPNVVPDWSSMPPRASCSTRRTSVAPLPPPHTEGINPPSDLLARLRSRTRRPCCSNAHAHLVTDTSSSNLVAPRAISGTRSTGANGLNRWSTLSAAAR